MNRPLQNCPYCGGNLSLDDLRGTDCPYCHTALPHHAQAAEHAALVNQMFAQQGVNYQIPYQYGAQPPPPPMGPAAPTPGVPMPPYVAYQVEHSMKAVNRAMTTSLIITIVVVVGVIGSLVIAAAVAALFVVL